MRSRLLRFPLLAVILAGAVGSVWLTGCGDNPDRERALRAIARWEDRRLAPADSLARMMGGSDPYVRLAAVRAAGLIGRDDALPLLIEALADGSATVRQQAAFALGILGSDEALPALTAALADRHLGLRVAALEGLGQLEHDGTAFYPFARAGVPREAVAAWDGLRNVAAQADHERLVAAIDSALTRPEPDIVWRVLRCAERAPAASLVARIAPFALADDVEVRVNALRALGRHSGDDALAAVLASCGANARWRERRLVRTRIAQMRALARLAGPALAADPAARLNSLAGRATDALILGVGADAPHVARTALDAVAQAVADIPLPPEAAAQESLLPVWRIRLAQAARNRLGDEVEAVAAAAVTAYAALRGPGGVAVWRPARDGRGPLVAAAVIEALAAYGTDLADYHDIGELAANDPSAAVRAQAVAALYRFAERRAEYLPTRAADQDRLAADARARLIGALADPDFTVVATAAPLLAHYPDGDVVTALADTYVATADGGEGAVDQRLAILTAMRELFTAYAADTERAVSVPLQTPGLPPADARADSTAEPPFASGDSADTRSAGTVAPEPAAIDAEHRARAARILRAAFDDADQRVRLEARDVAVATALLPDYLIPAAASLRATLPPVARDPRQPAVALPFAAPSVRCVTDRGTFVMRLHGEIAPNTCANFLALIAADFYREATFHRVVPDFVIQGGCPRGDGWGGPGYTIRSEWSRRPFTRGAVGIAHSGKDTGGSQWFVCHSAQPHLNGRYTLFATVTEGLDVVDQIQPGDLFRLVVENADVR